MSLGNAGLSARVEPVTTPPLADFAGGLLGYRVRVGSFANKAGADAVVARLPAGVTGSSVYTGWDGGSIAGVVHVRVVTIDPKRFSGRLISSFGPDIENRETTSALAARDGATAGVNGGYFVLDPLSGAPGDPAGIGVYRGRLLSEPINGRPALVVRSNAGGTSVVRYLWNGLVRRAGQPGRSLVLDGVDRQPGLIRNCGGTPDDQPTALPLHDITCVDPDETVLLTRDYGSSTPAGPGVEVVLDSSRHVVAVRSTRGGPLPVGGSSLQATGSDAALLRSLAPVGTLLDLRSRLLGNGRQATFDAGQFVVNGGPELVRDGHVHVTVAADGFVHPGDPSFYYGFVQKRNPRTFAGVDGQGRTVLVTADGRSQDDVGLSLLETAQVARSLGLVNAINLDGGGSTTMVVGGRVVNAPSDSTGERPVGDAVLVLPRR